MPFAPRNSAFARRTALVLAGTACAIGVLAPAPAHAVPVAFAQRMETAAACDPALGHLRLRMDVFGAFGIATSQGDSATFDPANDVPDRHAQGTVYESMGFLCAGRAGVRDGHTFESSEMVGTPVVADGQENRLTSTFRAGDVQVDLDARLDCNIVTECYTFTNRTAAALDELYFYPYMDGDLIFDAGSDNDRGARSLGNPPRLYEFDQGDNPATPTTYLALYADAAESRVTGWEVGGFSESRTRLASVARGCPAVHNAFRDRNLLDVDVNRDLLTDRGDDFTLALRVNVGPLAPGEQSAPFCQHIQWGLGRPCSDEDADGVCAPVDDCPLVPDPAQADRDHDGHGDACDVCPGVADAAQTDTDGDGAGDACDVCPAVADPGQADFDHDGRGDACDNCPTLPNPDQADANHDGRGDVCQNCLPGAVEVCDGADDNCDGQIDENPVGAGDPCVTGQLGVCALGHQVCAAGGLSCVAPAPAADDATCDGLDDDCDGTADEDAVLGDPCATGLPGICAVGARICANGAERCQSPSPTPEVCNGVDDNCDGQIDDAAAGTGEACDTGQPGVCGPGLRVCLAGALRCQGADPSNAPDDTCDGVDDDCDGFVDEDVRPGEACDTGGVGACAAGVRVCTDGGVTCVGADPAAEVCNGIDDNCDGVVDNNPAGLGEACDTGRPGACADGVRVCVAGGLRCDVADPGAPSADDATCDGIDNDCDGQIDEDAALGEACDTGLTGVCAAGLRQCVGGEAACVGGDPAAEICNGLDDNCDGVVDENAAGAGEACDTGRSGACADGVRVCVDGDLRCDGPAPAADDVTCDGLDDNCDGRIDEGAPVGQPCETGQAGVCAAGLRVCEAGAWRCDPQTAPSAERCDQLDNDCDGQVDNAPEAGLLCATGDVGVCAAGHQQCDGADTACTPDDVASEEVCDGQDNNCDGTIDEGLRNHCGVCGDDALDTCDGLDQDCDGRVDEDATCPNGGRCVRGQCLDPCVSNECPGDLRCVDGLCQPDCGPEGCVDPVSPYVPVCGDVSCAEGFFCREGACVSSCAERSCALYASCIDGECVPNPCGGVKCPDGDVCDQGRCVADPCVGAACPEGQRCENRDCVPDPCVGVTCPPGELCHVVQDTAQCGYPETAGGGVDTDAGPDTGPDTDATTDGGVVAILPPEDAALFAADGGKNGLQKATPSCNCRLNHDSSGGFPAALLGLACVVLQRRRQQGRK